MDLQDLLITPFFCLLLLFLVKPFVQKVGNKKEQQYLWLGWGLKVIGTIVLGLIYQYYYSGGDTFSYFRQGSLITRTFYNDPLLGLDLILNGGDYTPGNYLVASQMKWFKAAPEYLIIKLVGFIGIFCFATYSTIGIVFATFSFTGSLALYSVLRLKFPQLRKQLLISIFFIPSVILWGSGLLKDSIAIGLIGWTIYSFYKIIVEGKPTLKNISIAIIAIYFIYVIKIYLLISLIPALIYWLVKENTSRISSNQFIKRLVTPVFILIALGGTLPLVQYLASTSKRYSFDKIIERSKITSDYLYRISLEQGGAAYSLGSFDNNLSSYLSLAPEAIIVSTIRPFIWEVRNPLMLLSALESLVFTVLLIKLALSGNFLSKLRILMNSPFLQFCILFTIILGFAAGISTFNFGSLSRYRIPFLPFFMFYLLYLNKKNRLNKT